MARGRGTHLAPSVASAPAHVAGDDPLESHLHSLTPASHEAWLESLRSLHDPQALHLHLPEGAVQPGLRRDGSPSPVIALDLDSTIYPLMDALALMPGNEGFSMSEVSHWDYLVERFGGLKAMLTLLEQAMHTDHSLSVPPYEGAVSALEGIVSSHNARLVVMTDRPLSRVEHTVSYLDHHGVPYSAVLCGRLPDKLSVCQHIGAGLIVDDRPSTMEASHTAGLQVLSLRHPYNARVIEALSLPATDDWHRLGPAIGRALSPASP